MVVKARYDRSARASSTSSPLFAPERQPPRSARRRDIRPGAVEQHCSLNQHEHPSFGQQPLDSGVVCTKSNAGSDGAGIAVQCVGRCGHPRRRLPRRRPSTVRSARRPRDSAIPRPKARRAGRSTGRRSRRAEHRSLSVPSTKPPDTAASSPKHPAGLLTDGTMAGDPQPDRPSRGRDVVRARPRCSSAAGRDDSMTMSAPPVAVVSGCSSKSTAYECFPLFIPVEERRWPGAGAVGPPCGFDLHDGRAVRASSCPHRGPPTSRTGRRPAAGRLAAGPRRPMCDPRCCGTRFAERATGRPSMRARHGDMGGGVASTQCCTAGHGLSPTARTRAARVRLDVVLPRPKSARTNRRRCASAGAPPAESHFA